jgi:tetratricopeptide (TPR) repeat protein
MLALLVVLGLAAAVAAPFLRANSHYRQAQTALERHDLVRARAHLALGLRARPSSVALYLLLARTERLSGEYAEALQHLDRCRALHAPPEAVELEGLLLRAQRGDLDGSEAVLVARLEQEGPDTPPILEALTQRYLAAYRYRDALGCATRLIERWPFHAQALIWRGQVMQRLGHLADAAADYRRAVELDPEDAWSRICLGEVLLNLHQPDGAAEQFEYLAGQGEGNAAVQLGLARCRRGQGRPEEAATLLAKLSALYPEEAPIWTDRGQLAQEEGRLDEAEDCLRRAVRLRPKDHLAIHAFYQCLEARGRHDEAKTWRARLDQVERDEARLQELIRDVFHEPDTVPPRCEAGLLCLRLGQNEPARGWLESALRLDPQCAAAHQGLAQYFERTGNASAAARHRQLARAAPQPEASSRP